MLNCMKGSSCPFTLNELMKHHLPSRPSEVLPDSSAGKESACNAGDPSSIPGSGRSPGEEISYPFQYSWASLVAQLVNNLPAMWETWFDLWVGKISYRREQLPSPVSWPGELHGLGLQRVGNDWATFTFIFKDPRRFPTGPPLELPLQQILSIIAARLQRKGEFKKHLWPQVELTVSQTPGPSCSEMVGLALLRVLNHETGRRLSEEPEGSFRFVRLWDPRGKYHKCLPDSPCSHYLAQRLVNGNIERCSVFLEGNLACMPVTKQ